MVQIDLIGIDYKISLLSCRDVVPLLSIFQTGSNTTRLDVGGIVLF